LPLSQLDAGVEPSLDPPLSNYAPSAKVPSLLRRVGRLPTQAPPSSDESSAITPSVVAPSIRSFLAQKYTATLPLSAGAPCFEYLEYRPYRIYSVRMFCESLFNSPCANDAKIASVKRYSDRNGVPHRFLLFHIVRDNGTEFYLRMDRRRDHDIPLWVFGIRDLGGSNAVDAASRRGSIMIMLV
jgi:hypothetical protein